MKIENFKTSNEGLKSLIDFMHSPKNILHIDAEKAPFPWVYPNPISSHDNYDMYFSTMNFYSNDVDWLGY